MSDLNMIKYKVRKSARAKRMRIAVYCDGDVVVTVPKNFDLGLMDKFLAEKKDWILKKVREFLSSPLRFIKRRSKSDYKKYENEAMALVVKRINYLNQNLNLKYNKINIKDQKTRWGSCSKKGNLNFNYKILFLSAEIRDYIIVHELCHLKEFNHSKIFWNLVRSVIPDYLEIRNSLKLK
jgi:predicted metal-dependent hydrolase